MRAPGRGLLVSLLSSSPRSGHRAGHLLPPDGPTALLTADHASLRSARTQVPVTTRDGKRQVGKEDSAAVLLAGVLGNPCVCRRRSPPRGSRGETFRGE